MDHNGSGGNASEGNTKIARTPLGKFWQGTLNNWKMDQKDHILGILNKNNYKWLMCEEVAPTTGTKHLHFFIKSEKRFRACEKFKIKEIHWELCKGDEESNIKYITKGGIVEGNLKLPKPLKILEDEKLYAWQKDVLEIIRTEPDDRTIHWLWEKKGCAGKTTFCKYLSHKFGAVPLEGKKNDILYCAAIFESDIYVWDLERSMEEYVSYGALEKIKNGYFMCSKYESKPVIRNCPHVFVFANFEPDVSRLSKDKWNIVHIGSDDELEEVEYGSATESDDLTAYL